MKKFTENEIQWMKTNAKKYTVKGMAGKLKRNPSSINCKIKGLKLDVIKVHTGQCIKQGYVFIKDATHPNAHTDGYINEARLVMSSHLGRKLRKNEVVHHKNEKRNDNRITNLLLTNRSDHAKIHWKKLLKAKAYYEARGGV